MAFTCPFTTQIMFDPVLATDGNTYEREAIQNRFDRGETSASPAGDGVFTGTTLIPNKMILTANVSHLEAHSDPWVALANVYLPESRKTALAEAIVCGDLASIQSEKLANGLFELDKRLLVYPLRDGLSAFHLADGSEKSFGVCEWILSELVAVDGLVDRVVVPTEWPDGYQAFHSLKLLRKQVLQQPPSHEFVKKAEALVKLGANACDIINPSNGNTLLHETAVKGLAGACHWLLGKGLDPMKENSQGRTPFVEAVLGSAVSKEHRLDVLSALAQCEPEVPFIHHIFRMKTDGKFGKFPILAAMEETYGAELAEFIDECDASGQTALQTLVSAGGDVVSIRWLLDHGANPNLEDSKTGITLLRFVASHVSAGDDGWKIILADLVRHGATLDPDTIKTLEALKDKRLDLAIEDALHDSHQAPCQALQKEVEQQQFELLALQRATDELTRKLDHSAQKRASDTEQLCAQQASIVELHRKWDAVKRNREEKKWLGCKRKNQIGVGDRVRVQKYPASGYEYLNPSEFGQVATVVDIHVNDPSIQLQFSDGHTTFYHDQDLDVWIGKPSELPATWRRCVDVKQLLEGQPVRMAGKPSSGFFYRYPEFFGQKATIASILPPDTASETPLLTLRFESSGQLGRDFVHPLDVEVELTREWIRCKSTKDLQLGQVVRIHRRPKDGDRARAGTVGTVIQLPELDGHEDDPDRSSVRLRFRLNEESSFGYRDLEVHPWDVDTSRAVTRWFWHSVRGIDELSVGQTVRVRRRPRSGFIYVEKKEFGQIATIENKGDIGPCALRFKYDGHVGDIRYHWEDLKIRKPGRPSDGDSDSDVASPSRRRLAKDGTESLPCCLM